MLRIGKREARGKRHLAEEGGAPGAGGSGGLLNIKLFSRCPRRPTAALKGRPIIAQSSQPAKIQVRGIYSASTPDGSKVRCAAPVLDVRVGQRVSPVRADWNSP